MSSRGPVRGCLVVVRAGLAGADVTEIDGVPVTTPERTIVDVGSLPPHREAVVLTDALLHGERASLAAVRAAAAERSGRRGVRRLRAVLDAAEPLTESPQESRLRLALVAGGLPRPVAQHVVRGAGGAFVARVDLAYPDLRVAIEYDGRASHPVGLTRDRDRSWRLHRAGWLAVHVTAELLRRRRELCRRVVEAREEQAARPLP